MPVTITKTIKKTPPRIPADEITAKIASKQYDLSLVYIGKKRAKALNIAHRNKDYIPNILSFPLDERTGEIFICPEVAKKDAGNFDLSYRNYLIFLLIHGILHLKGHDHGDTMEGLERKYLKQFATKL